MASMLRKPSASVIFLHGSGDTGPNVLEWIRGLLGRDFKGSHIKFTYPTAPMQKYTPFDDDLTTVWFNRQSVDIAAEEDPGSMSQSYDIARQLVQQEVDGGIPLNRIIIGGFSMGGALALHTGYHLNTSLGGVFAHSSFLNRKSVVYESLANNSNATPPELCMFHGKDDAVVEFQWGRETFEMLQKLGVTGTFTALDNTAHELQRSSMLDVESWILKKLP